MTYDFRALILDSVRALQKERPLFHSEADFQHALAWAIHATSPECRIRLEKRLVISGSPLYVDVWVDAYGDSCAIELKYKTTKLTARIDEENYELAEHSAHDTARYDFINDVVRIVSLFHAQYCSVGFALLITNVSALTDSPTDSRWKRAMDRDFRIHDGTTLSGSLTWGDAASVGSLRKRSRTIKLAAEYACRWRPYSTLGSAASEKLRMLLLEIGSGGEKLG